jgi:hypothetical protein
MDASIAPIAPNESMAAFVTLALIRLLMLPTNSRAVLHASARVVYCDNHINPPFGTFWSRVQFMASEN